MELKPKGHSRWRGFTPEQRTKADGWLFEENATYREVVERCQKEFGLKVTMSGVARHFRQEYRLRSRDRLGRGVHEQAEALKVLEQEEERAEGSYLLILRMVENMAAEETLKPAKERDYRKVGYLLRTVITARQEANEFSRVSLAREKLEYDVATACLVHKIGMDKICEDRTLNEGERIRAIREELFGPNLPK